MAAVRSVDRQSRAERAFRCGIILLSGADLSKQGMVDCVLGGALDQRGGHLRHLVELARLQFRNYERRSGNWRARLLTEHLFQRCKTLLALTGFDLRYPDPCLDGRVVGIESGRFFWNCCKARFGLWSAI